MMNIPPKALSDTDIMPHVAELQDPDALPEFDARTSRFSYIFFTIIWLLLSLPLSLIALSRAQPQFAIALLLGPGLGIVMLVWLRGFRLRIINGVFEYRDGFYRTRRCLFHDIQSYSNKWLPYDFDRKLYKNAQKVKRRMILRIHDQQPILIDTGKFGPHVVSFEKRVKAHVLSLRASAKAQKSALRNKAHSSSDIPPRKHSQRDDL